MKITRYLLFVAMCNFLLQGCNMINPKETIPTFIQIDSVQLLATNPSLHGSVSHKITDVWVYYNRQLLGAYQVPAKIPVLASSNGELEILAGIWENGLSGTRAKYPFYTLDTFYFSPQPGKIISHQPVFNYRPVDSLNTSYFFEDFEQGNSFERLFGDTTFVKTSDPSEVFEGSWSDKLDLHDTITSGQAISIQQFTLPSDKMCYVELNYKSDIPFVMRTKVTKSGASETLDMIGINASPSKWGKIYFNFGPYVATYQNAAFKFVFEAKLPDGVTQGKVLIDNFKVIHFN